MNLVIEHDQHTEIPRDGRSRHTQRVDEVDAGVGPERAHRTLRTNQYHGLGNGERQVQEERGLFERGSPMQNDKPCQVLFAGRGRMQDFAQLDPVSRPDRCAADRTKRNRQRVRDEPRLRKAVQYLGNRQLPAEVWIVDAVQAGFSPGRNRAASADHRNPGKRGCHVLLLVCMDREFQRSRPVISVYGQTKTRCHLCELQYGLRRSTSRIATGAAYARAEFQTAPKGVGAAALATFLRDTVLLFVILSRSVTLTATETTESEAVEELEN